MKQERRIDKKWQIQNRWQKNKGQRIESKRQRKDGSKLKKEETEKKNYKGRG